MDRAGFDLDELLRAQLRLGWSRLFALVVVVPSLLVLFYGAVIASPQYVSRAEYMIRGVEQPRPGGGALAGLVGQDGTGSAQGESQALRDFLLSGDAIAALKARGIDLRALYTRSDVDWFSRLRPADPPDEELLDFYRRHVAIDYDSTANVTRLSVRTFTPADAQGLARALVALGEQQVNAFNLKAIAAARQDAEANLAGAEVEIAEIQGKLTAFRDLTRDIDPARNSQGAQEALEKAEAELIAERAELAGMRQSLAPASPLVIAAQGRVHMLEQTSAQLRARLTGGAGAINHRLAAFEELKIKQELAVKRYDDARARLARANDQAGRERLFLVPVVSAGLPQKPVYPRPLSSSLAVFAALCVAFAIGWLLLAGIREHMAD